MRNKIKTNLMLFMLILVTMFSCGITAYAQIASNPNIDTKTKSYYFNNELSSVVSPYSKYANWTTESTKYGKCATSGGSYWATEAIEYLLDNDIIRGVKDIKDGKSYVPSGNYIVGRDGLAITLFYHWSDTRTNRQGTYDNPIILFNGYDNTKILDKVKYTNGSGLTRKQAAAILATSIQIKSGGETKLSTYHSSGLGMYANGVKFASTDGYKDAGSLSMDGIYYQAFNLLMDLNVCQGRTYLEKINGKEQVVTKLVPDELITYEEYYCWLLNLKEVMPPPEKPAYSLSAKVEVTATNATVNYKDFLKCNEDGQAQITVTTNASNSTGNPNIEHYFHKIVETKPSNIKGREIDSGKMVANGGTKFFRTLTYFANTIKAKDITSSTDKENSKKAVTEDLRSGKGDCTYKITYEGSVTAYNTQDGKEVSDTATESTTGSVILYNNAPYAECKAYTLNGVTEGYKNNFFYIGKPIKIKDLCYDKEDDNEYPETVQYRITKLGNDTSLASSINFDNAKI